MTCAGTFYETIKNCSTEIIDDFFPGVFSPLFFRRFRGIRLPSQEVELLQVDKSAKVKSFS